MTTTSSASSTPSTDVRLLCVGEALIDVVHQGPLDSHLPSSEHVGGSLINVACGLGVLGHTVALQSWFGRDERGELLRAWADESGVALAEGTQGAERTPVAHAVLDVHGHATYTFEVEWRIPTLAPHEQVDHLHTGSYAATLEPGGSRIVELAELVHDHGTVSYDPNIRPALMGSPEAVRDRIETLVGLSDLVKVSDEDLDWLYGDVALADVIRDWTSRGPAMVVVTRGPFGSVAGLAGQDEQVQLDPLPVQVHDSVGAGDSFMAGLLSGLVDAGLLGSREAASRLAAATWDDVLPALHRATATSALTVTHAGAHTPTRDEVARILAEKPVTSGT